MGRRPDPAALGRRGPLRVRAAGGDRRPGRGGGGAGRPDRLHQDMYARTLAAVGLDPAYGAYLDVVSAISLAAANVMSLFALHRRLVGAGVGHFAAFEASSSVPSRRVAAGLERLG